MKINFCQRLMTLKNTPMFEKSFESMVVSKAMKLAPGRLFANFEELMAFLDEQKVTHSEIFEAEGAPLCLKDICAEALMLKGISFSEVLPGREELVRFSLAKCIMDSKEAISVKMQEVRLIQELISRLPPSVGPLVSGQASFMLEQGEKEESDSTEPAPVLKADVSKQVPKREIPQRHN